MNIKFSILLLILPGIYLGCASHSNLTPKSTQEQPIVVPGDRIRVTVPNDVWNKLSLPYELREKKRIIGTAVVLNADSLVLENQVTTLRLLLSSVNMVELSRGRKQYTGHTFKFLGAFGGAMIGTVAGAAIGYKVDPCRDPDEPKCEELNQLRGLFLGGLIGGVLGTFGGRAIGAEIDSSFRGERWDEIPMEAIRGNSN